MGFRVAARMAAPNWTAPPPTYNLEAAESAAVDCRAAVLRPNDEFLTTLRSLVDQWIASGFSSDNPKTRTELPRERNADVLPTGYTQSLKSILSDWVARNPRPIVVLNTGKLGVLVQTPRPGAKIAQYAKDCAIHWFHELVSSDAAFRVAKCATCGNYYSRKRLPRPTSLLRDEHTAPIRSVLGPGPWNVRMPRGMNEDGHW